MYCISFTVLYCIASCHCCYCIVTDGHPYNNSYRTIASASIRLISLQTHSAVHITAFRREVKRGDHHFNTKQSPHLFCKRTSSVYSWKQYVTVTIEIRCVVKISRIAVAWRSNGWFLFNKIKKFLTVMSNRKQYTSRDNKSKSKSSNK